MFFGVGLGIKKDCPTSNFTTKEQYPCLCVAGSGTGIPLSITIGFIDKSPLARPVEDSGKTPRLARRSLDATVLDDEPRP